MPYPVSLAGLRFEARMTVVRLGDGSLVVHSPGPIDAALRDWMFALGRVAVIVAPGNFHHLHVMDCQRAFPDAETWICPGVERKQRGLRFDGMLGERLPASMRAGFGQAFVQGRLMAEVPLLHRPTRTLLLVDLVERFRRRHAEREPGVARLLEAVRHCGTVRRPRPSTASPGGVDQRCRVALERVLGWDFERGDLARRV